MGKKDHLINYNYIASFILMSVGTPVGEQYKCTPHAYSYTHKHTQTLTYIKPF